MSNQPEIRIHEEAEPRVPGSVSLITDEPVAIPRDGSLEAARQRLAYAVSRRPWLVPSLLLGSALVYLLLRRR